jgi:cell division septum initiation protein DivIVA
MAKDAAKDLIKAIAAGSTRLAADAEPDFRQLAETVRTKLRLMSQALTRCYEQAQNAGDIDRADAIDQVISYLDVVRIGIGQKIIDYLDGTPEVAKACASITEAAEAMEAEAERTAGSADDLKKATVLVDGLTKLVGWVKDKAKPA